MSALIRMIHIHLKVCILLSAENKASYTTHVNYACIELMPYISGNLGGNFVTFVPEKGWKFSPENLDFLKNSCRQ